jgi:integrase
MTGALLALRWVDVHLDKRAVSISRSLEETKRHGKRITTPKTANSIRRFPIDAGLAAILGAECRRQGGLSELVFPGTRGPRNKKTAGSGPPSWASISVSRISAHRMGLHSSIEGGPVHTAAERPATTRRWSASTSSAPARATRTPHGDRGHGPDLSNFLSRRSQVRGMFQLKACRQRPNSGGTAISVISLRGQF